MLSKSVAEVVVDHRCLLGEGPVWDIKKQRILWVDILRGNIHTFYPDSNKFDTFNVGRLVGAIALCAEGGLIAALEDGFALIDIEKREITSLKDPEAHLAGNRFNDGKCDPAGRFWAGTMSLSEDFGKGNLYILEKNNLVTKKIEGVTVSNGMAWSLDNTKFYYIDSPTREVVVYDYDISSGNISNKKTIIKVPEKDGFPDGITIDSEGMLWVAHWGGWAVIRWNPSTGKQIDRISLPVEKVTSCTFGGKDLKDLYITTASKELTEDELKHQSLAGSMFVVRDCGYSGLPPFEFQQ